MYKETENDNIKQVCNYIRRQSRAHNNTKTNENNNTNLVIYKHL